jgi:hypothetical protein
MAESKNIGVKLIILGVVIVVGGAIFVKANSSSSSTSDSTSITAPSSPTASENENPGEGLGCAISAAGVAKVAEEMSEQEKFAAIVTGIVGEYMIGKACENVLESWYYHPQTAATVNLGNDGTTQAGSVTQQTVTGNQLLQMAQAQAVQQQDRQARTQFMLNCIRSFGFKKKKKK